MFSTPSKHSSCIGEYDHIWWNFKNNYENKSLPRDALTSWQGFGIFSFLQIYWLGRFRVGKQPFIHPCKNKIDLRRKKVTWFFKDQNITFFFKWIPDGQKSQETPRILQDKFPQFFPPFFFFFSFLTRTFFFGSAKK